mgnify:FL=1
MTSLKPGQLVTGRDRYGKKPVYHMPGDFFPIAEKREYEDIFLM